MKHFDNIGRKEIIIVMLFAYYFIGRLLSNYYQFYYMASDVFFSLEAIIFAIYCWTDVKKFKLFYKACYAGILALFFINLFSSVNRCSIKYHNSTKTAIEIDRIIEKNYLNYITELSKPFIIFGVVIAVIYLFKLKSPKDE